MMKPITTLLGLLTGMAEPAMAQEPIVQPQQQSQKAFDFYRKVYGMESNKESQPISLDNKPYQAIQKNTTEYIPKEKLNEYQKNISLGMSPIAAAQKYYNQFGQNITQADFSGKVKMSDYFKSYPSNEAFSKDTANLLQQQYGIGNKPMTTLEFGQALERGGYATMKDKKGNPIYATQIVGTEKRANLVRDLVLSPEFQALTAEEQYKKLSNKNYAHESFLQPKTNNIDIAKVETMKQNIPIAWEAAQNISSLLNNNVKPESIFAKMANETGYFTKPIANYNFSSVKIKNADRLNLRLKGNILP